MYSDAVERLRNDLNATGQNTDTFLSGITGPSAVIARQVLGDLLAMCDSTTLPTEVGSLRLDMEQTTVPSMTRSGLVVEIELQVGELEEMVFCEVSDDMVPDVWELLQMCEKNRQECIFWDDLVRFRRNLFVKHASNDIAESFDESDDLVLGTLADWERLEQIGAPAYRHHFWRYYAADGRVYAVTIHETS